MGDTMLCLGCGAPPSEHGQGPGDGGGCPGDHPVNALALYRMWCTEQQRADAAAAEVARLRAIVRSTVDLFDAIVANVESIQTEPHTHQQGVWLTTIECHAKVGAKDLRSALAAHEGQKAEALGTCGTRSHEGATLVHAQMADCEEWSPIVTPAKETP